MNFISNVTFIYKDSFFSFFFEVSANCQLVGDANRINPANCGQRIAEQTTNYVKIVGGSNADPQVPNLSF
jgi:hypothetical protein